ncbi:MAG: outer membrane lipoprotein carrier protein LolA [Prevotella sp.]|jgi:outer membrane lipoprotein carrier protein|nr:outer membrane lipoprotein carrier protein LolA [Prevotella sp.]MBR6190511.1 outer membrane lipoprotein carrier protein LolA [Prevotella sp.]
MKRITISLLFLFSLFFSVAQAQGDDAQIRQKIAVAAQTMTSMQCDFVQTKQLKMLNDKMVSEGRMYYSQKDKLRWEYVKPYQYTFIMNGDRVLLKNKERSDVIDVRQNKIFREIANIMLNSVVGNCLNDDRSFKTSITTAGGQWVATLLPQRKDMKQMFQKIILHFDQQQATVSRVELVEKNGDLTTIDLKNIRKNETIAPRTFAVE